MTTYLKNDEEIEWAQYFGRNLQRMLHKKNISQGCLARRLGSTDSMISRYVHGTSVPSVYKVTRIAEILDCDICELIKANYDE